MPKGGILIESPRDYFADAYGIGHRYAEMGKLIVDQGPKTSRRRCWPARARSAR
jgi:hypothetical protein